MQCKESGDVWLEGGVMWLCIDGWILGWYYVSECELSGARLGLPTIR